MGGATAHASHAATLRDYLQVVRRRKWIILSTTVLVPLAAVAFSLGQQRLYEAKSQVLLSRQNLANTLTGAQDPTLSEQQVEVTQTQADVARVPIIASRVLKQVRSTKLTTQQLLDDSSVSSPANADLLTFSVTNHDPLTAQRLANAYATQYTVYRRELDTAAIQKALTSVGNSIKQLAKAGGGHSALYNQLVEHQQTLATMEALQTSNASVVQQASSATRVQPKPTRNAVLGFFLGLVLGIGLAFLWEALDTRVRSAHEIGERLGGLPLLARIPEPSKKLRTHDDLAMIEDPAGVQAETFRMLRTNLAFVTLDRDARTLMITSAVEQEGKSTTIANLAVALARAGHRVALVDLDLRRPYVHKFFNVRGPGLTEVVLGHASLNEALSPIAIVDPGEQRQSSNGNGNGHANGNGNGHAKWSKGMLEVLPAGPIPPDPGDFIGKHALSELLAQLRKRCDFVLIDAPPVLHVGDAIALSTKVDGIIVVTRMKLVRKQMLSELGRQLATVPTPILGFVLTGAGEEEGYGDRYGYGYGYGYAYYPRAYEQPEKTESARSFP
jgi:polysaccharide biosynthesis transport protein